MEPQSTVAGILDMKLASVIIKRNQCVKTWFLPIQGNFRWTELQIKVWFDDKLAPVWNKSWGQVQWFAGSKRGGGPWKGHWPLGSCIAAATAAVLVPRGRGCPCCSVSASVQSCKFRSWSRKTIKTFRQYPENKFAKMRLSLPIQLEEKNLVGVAFNKQSASTAVLVSNESGNATL